MSKFGNNRTFKSFGKPEQLVISDKISQNKLKKQHKQFKKENNDNLGVSDADFELMMAENETNNQNKNIKLLYNVPESTNVTNFVKELINKKLIGEELENYIEINQNCLNGIELLNGLLNTQNDISDLSWFRQENYGLGLKKLFDSNIHDQVIGLLMLQNHCSKHEFPKIQYKNSSIYLLKVLFQLFFTFDIFDEDAYWNWQEYINDNDKFNYDLKNILSVQTAEFFIILKTVFNEEDYEEDEKNDDECKNNKQNNNNYQKQFVKEESSSEEESDDSIGVPEEQDFNLDDI